MKMNKGIAVALAATIIASGGGFTGAIVNATPAYAASTQTEIDAAVAQILKDTNAQRAAAGLKPLVLSSTMSQVSQAWTQQMASDKAMTHNPNYQFELPAPWIRVGENVAQGYTPSTVMAAWMASPGHKANILGDFTHIGLGYYVDETGRGWFTQNFGKYQIPNPTAPPTPNNLVSSDGFTSKWTAQTNDLIDTYIAELYSPDGTLIGTQTVDPSTPEVTFTGLSDKTTYTVKLKSHATDATGIEYYSPVTTYTVTTFQELPTVTAPPNLNLWLGTTSIEAVWDVPEAIHGNLQPYKVEIKEGTTVVESITTTDTSYTFNGLKPDTNYTVNVTATSTIQDRVATAVSTQSTRTGVDVTAAAVSEPTNLTVAAPQYFYLTAAWGAPTVQSGTNFRYIVTLKQAGKPDSVVETTLNDYTWMGLTANTPYTVTVQSVIESWDGTKKVTTVGVSGSATTPSNPDSVSVSAPTALTATAQATQATLNWTAPQTVVGKINNYTVTVKQTGKVDRVIATPNATTSFVVTGLTENTPYTFEVKANAVSTSGSNFATSVPVSVAKTTPYAPSTVIVNAPTNVTATAPNSNQVNVAWTAPTGTVGTLTGYKVSLKEVATGATVSTQNVASLNTSFTGLKDNTSYSAEVTALASSPDNTKTAVSSIAKATVLTPPIAGPLSAPNAPSGLGVGSVFYNAATVTWNAPIGIVGGTVADYTVTVKRTGQPDRVFKTTNPSLQVTGLAENAAYTVIVVANVVSTDGLNTVTTPAANVVFTTPYSPSTVKVNAPTGLKFSTVAYNSLTASWTAPTGTVGTIKNYTVVLKQGTIVKGTYTTTGTSYALTGLASNTNYTVEVKANAVSPNSLQLASSGVVTLSGVTAKSPVVSVAKPALTVSGVKYNGATISWKKPAATGTITGYTVQVKLGTTVKQTYNVSAATYSKAITGLAENTNYVFVVQAFAVAQNGINKAASYNTALFKTTLSAASTVKVSAPPVTLYAARTSITAKWTRPYVYGKILNYTVTLKKGTTTVYTYTTTGGLLNFYSLQPGTTYTVSVRANAVSANGKYRAYATTTKSIVTKR